MADEKPDAKPSRAYRGQTPIANQIVIRPAEPNTKGQTPLPKVVPPKKPKS